MSAHSKSVSTGFNRNLLAHRLEQLNTADAKGDISFRGFGLDEVVTVLESAVDFEVGMPEVQRRGYVYAAVLDSAQAGVITADAILRKINAGERAFEALPRRGYVYVTGLSIRYFDGIHDRWMGAAGSSSVATFPLNSTARTRRRAPLARIRSSERCRVWSGLEWTFLRSGGLATNTLGWAEQIRADGVVREPYGRAARSLIHERDIAAVAVRALTEDGHGGEKYVLTGPEVLTQVEQVRAVSEAIGRPLRFEEIPPEDARRVMLAQGRPAAAVDGILAAHAKMVAQPERVTRTVEVVTGEPARTFRQWAIDHADDFR